MKLLLLLFVILSIVNNSFSEPQLIDADYTALSAYLGGQYSYVDFQVKYPVSPTLKYIDFCNSTLYSTSLTCKVIDNIYYVDKIIAPGARYPYTTYGYSFLKDFTNLSYVDINNFIVDQTIFGDENSGQKGYSPSIQIRNSPIQSNTLKDAGVIPLPTTNLVIISALDSYITQINLSTLKNLKYFSLTFNGTATSQTTPSFNNDITVLNSNQLISSFSTIASAVPNFNNFNIDSLSLSLVNGFDTSTISNFAYFSTVNKLSVNFDISSSYDFPSTLTGKNIVFSGKFNSISNQIDLSSSNAVSIVVSDKDLSFNYQGEVPFTNYPLSMNLLTLGNSQINKFPTEIGSNLTTLNLQNNLLSGPLPDVSKTKIVNLNLASNKFSGTIPTSYCQLNLYNLNLSSNVELESPLPQCFLCYLRSNASVISNSFAGITNITNSLVSQPNGCGLIYPTISYDSTSNTITLKGDYLGWGSPLATFTDNTGKIAYLEFTPIIYGSTFTAKWNNNYAIPSIFNFQFDTDNYQVATTPTNPKATSITASGNTLSITGQFFSYRSSEITVTVDPSNTNLNCVVNSQSKFDQFSCTVDSSTPIPTGSNVVVIISVNGLTTQITFDSSLSTAQSVTYCQKTCQNSRMCFTTTGKCDCGSSWQSIDCSVPFKSCSGDCSSTIGQGSCNNQTGVCVCNDLYNTPNCYYPSQYMTSVTSPPNNGGNITIIGWFGNTNNQLNVQISSKQCPYSFLNQTVIICNAPPGEGTKTITITQNNLVWTGSNAFHYSGLFTCSNDCNSGSNQGTCNTTNGNCVCSGGWSGYDCGSKQTNTSTSIDDGSAIISDEKLAYQILVTTLLEIDIDGSSEKEITLSTWYPLLNETTTNKYVYYQYLDSSNHSIITYSIEEIKENRDFEFAGLSIVLDQGSLKMSVSIKNYVYQSVFNTLQLQFKSKVSINEGGDDCNSDSTSFNTNELDKNQLLNYVSITKNKKTLYGRFINRAISDGRPTFMTTTPVSTKDDTLIVGINLPHCVQECLIDPDFSVLVSNDISDCKTKRAAWVVPVAVVIPCVAVAALIITVSYLYRKHRMTIMMAKDKYKFSLRNLSRKDKGELYMPNEGEKA